MLQLQEKYWVQLHSQGLLTEVHLWDFTHRGKRISESEQRLNQAWIHQKASRYSFVRVLTEPGPDDCNATDEPCRACASDAVCYNQYYQYYPEHTKPHDVVVKVDDDTLFVNVSEFKCFVQFVHDNADVFLVSANVVNNAVVAHAQQTLGVLPASLGTFEFPPDGNPRKSSLYRSARKAHDLHRYFLSHQSDFFRESLVQVKSRLSINFIGFSHANSREISRLTWKVFLDRRRHEKLTRKLTRKWWDHDAYDEAALTTYASAVLNRKEVVYMRLVVAHGSKSSQMKDNPRLVHQTVQMYLNVTKGTPTL